MKELKQAIQNEVIKQSAFKWIPGVGFPRMVNLSEGGTIEDSFQDLAHWELTSDPSTHQPSIILKSAGETRAVLVLTSKGVFRGREFGSNGHCYLEPDADDVSNFSMLADPTRYKEFVIACAKDAEPPHKKWEKHKYNLNDAITRQDLKGDKTALALIACDRPAYLERVVAALEKNDEAHNLPIFAFIDKPWKDDGLVEQQVRTIRDAFPHVVIVKREVNFGCGRNIIDARHQLFTNLGYEQVFLFEDDMVPSINYIPYCLNMMEYLRNRYSNVGAVQGWNKCHLSIEKKENRASEVTATYTNWWGYLMRKEAWEAIKKQMFYYQDAFLSVPYPDRNHQKIREWLGKMMREPMQSVGNLQLPPTADAKTHRRNYFDSPPTGQDGVTMCLFHQAGFIRVAPTVNRGLYIGQKGIHMSPKQFVQDGFASMSLDEFDRDGSRKRFKVLK